MVFFQPFHALIARRELSTQGLGQKAVELDKETALLEAEITAARAEAKKQALAARDAAIAVSQVKASELVAKAKAAAKIELEAAREMNEKAAAKERDALAGQAEPMVRALSDQLLHKKKASF